MQYRYLGSSGLKVSALSFGSWVTFGAQIDEAKAEQCMTAAYDAGVNFFDTAETYAAGKAETMMGRVIRRQGWKRSDLVIATKIFWGGKGPNDRGLSRKHIIEGTLASLERLQMEYVDLLFCHRPDPETPIEETVRAMSHLVDSGRAFYWGTSEWSADQIAAAHGIARQQHLVPPTMEQPQYNMFHRHRVEREYARLYRDIGLGTTIWSPLAGGILSGKYEHGVPEDSRSNAPGYDWLRERFAGQEGQQRIAVASRLRPLAEDLGITLPRLALAWCLRGPEVSSVITGASRPEQVTENMKAIDDLEKLTPEVLQHIEEILGNRPQPEESFR